MNHTQNLQLPQWEAADRVTRSDINGAFSAIDTAIGALSGAAQLAAGSYVGDGTYGAQHPKSLTFPFPPKFFMVRGRSDQYAQECSWWLGGTGGYNVSAAWGDPMLKNVSVSGNTLSWYSSGSDGQFNGSGDTYYWIALG